MENEIKIIIENFDWKVLIKKFRPHMIAPLLSYEIGMRTARAIFNWNFRDDTVINYAIDLFFSIRDIHEIKWNEDSKNDLYVAELCQLTLRYQDAFDSIKRAYDLSKPNSSLLVLFYFANTYFLPPEADTIAQEEALQLFEKSFQKQPTREAALLIRDIYGYRKDVANYDHWDAVMKDVESRNLHIPVIIPDVFSEKYDQRN